MFKAPVKDPYFNKKLQYPIPIKDCRVREVEDQAEYHIREGKGKRPHMWYRRIRDL